MIIFSAPPKRTTSTLTFLLLPVQVLVLLIAMTCLAGGTGNFHLLSQHQRPIHFFATGVRKQFHSCSRAHKHLFTFRRGTGSAFTPSAPPAPAPSSLWPIASKTFYQQKPSLLIIHPNRNNHQPQPHRCSSSRLFQSSSSSSPIEISTPPPTPPTPSSSSHSNYITSKSKQDEFHKLIEQESNSIDYPKGIPEGFYIIQQYNVPDAETFNDMLQNAVTSGSDSDSDSGSGTTATDGDSDGSSMGTSMGITQDELDRLGINDGQNVTLPIALMLLDPKEYPSFSKARKACRKGYIIIHRGPLDPLDPLESEPEPEQQSREEDAKQFIFNRTKSIRGRVADRVYPNDVIGRQVRMHGGFYPGLDCKKPPFDLPVVYEDDHFAIVNKPAGVVIYAQRNQGHGMMTIRAALPFVLKPPKRGTLAIIRRPVSVHRLDKPTSGLLLIAKTKPAMIDLTKQFVERRVKKTYTAILNGVPDEPIESSITALEAQQMGVDVDVDIEENEALANSRPWQLIDSPLDDGNSVKSAVTVWKPLEYVKSLKAKDGILTLVEMKPKTGRYHQLRRHMVSFSAAG